MSLGLPRRNATSSGRTTSSPARRARGAMSPERPKCPPGQVQRRVRRASPFGVLGLGASRAASRTHTSSESARTFSRETTPAQARTARTRATSSFDSYCRSVASLLSRIGPWRPPSRAGLAAHAPGFRSTGRLPTRAALALADTARCAVANVVTVPAGRPIRALDTEQVENVADQGVKSVPVLGPRIETASTATASSTPSPKETGRQCWKYRRQPVKNSDRAGPAPPHRTQSSVGP